MQPCPLLLEKPYETHRSFAEQRLEHSEIDEPPSWYTGASAGMFELRELRRLQIVVVDWASMLVCVVVWVTGTMEVDMLVSVNISVAVETDVAVEVVICVKERVMNNVLVLVCETVLVCGTVVD